MTPDKVEELFRNIPEDEESKIDILKQIYGAVKELQVTNSTELEAFVEKIGNGSRQGQWRIPLGKSGLLDLFLNLVKGDDQDVAVAAHALRVIGNTCADQDENRQRVVESGCLPRLVAMLGHDTLVRFAVPVLFNICVDYEPAQTAAYKAGLTIYLVDIISKPRLREAVAPYISFVYNLFGLMATQEFEPDLVPLATPFCLLTQARASISLSSDSSDETDVFLGLSSTALTYLSSQQLQEVFLETPGAISLFLEAFQTAAKDASLPQSDDAGDQAQLKQLQLAFTETLADLSANPRFAEMCPLDSRPASLLLHWVSSPANQMPLQAAACLALGNIARSDAPCVALVQNISVHKALIAILASDSSATDAQLLHSVLSFLKNLSIPASNKPVLCHAGLLDYHVLPRIWDLDTQPQVQFDAVSLARLLLVNCPTTVRRVCAPSPNSDSLSSPPDRTLLRQLMDLHRKADQEPTKMETARAVANVCRVLHSDKPVGSSLLPAVPSSSFLSSEAEARSLLQDFYSTHHALADVLVYLGLQAKFPVLRSELWFVLALMVRSAEGAAVVIQAINEQPRIVGILVGAVTGEKIPGEKQTPRDGGNSNPSAGLDDLSAISGALDQLEPQQVDLAKIATMAKVDRENGLVLIAELLKQYPDKLNPSARSAFSRILKAGGELVLGDRNEKTQGEIPNQ
ncbi:ARM repeat-containing protein [Hypoxylon cercidicola]|nr:ARM repeat-containing protein [Hypoxylon cercidicola]